MVITLNVDKFDVSKQEVTFLGHIIYSIGISPQPRKANEEGVANYGRRAEEFSLHG